MHVSVFICKKLPHGGFYFLYVVKNVVNCKLKSQKGIVSHSIFLLDYQMQTKPESWRRPPAHILTMLIHEALLSVLIYASIIILALQLFPYMKVDCLFLDLIYELPLEHHSGWNAHLNYTQIYRIKGGTIQLGYWKA